MGTRKARYLIPLVLIFGLGAFYYYSVQPNAETTERSESRSTDPSQEIERFTLVETVSADEVWKLRAPHATKTGNRIRLTSPRLAVIQSQDTSATVHADRGSYDYQKQTLLLRGNVVIQWLTKKMTLRTEELTWDRSANIVSTTKPVALESPRGILKAVGAEADLSREHVTFRSRVEFISSS